MEEDRVRLARVRSPQDDDVGLLDFPIGAGAAARSEDRRQTDDAGSVSGAVAAVDVVVAEDRASELLREEVHLVRRVRAAEDSERFRPWRSSERRKPAAARRAPRPTSRALRSRLAGSAVGSDARERFRHDRLGPYHGGGARTTRRRLWHHRRYRLCCVRRSPATSGPRVRRVAGTYRPARAPAYGRRSRGRRLWKSRV